MNPPIPTGTVTDTPAAAPTPAVETTVVETRPGQVASSPVEKPTPAAPVEDGKELSGMDLLRAAREEEEAERAKRLTPASESAAKPDEQTTPPAGTTPPPATTQDEPVDWQKRATEAENQIAAQQVRQQRAQAEQLNQQQYAIMEKKYAALKATEETLPDLEAAAVEAFNVYGNGTPQYRSAYNLWMASKTNYESALESYNKQYDDFVDSNAKSQAKQYETYLDSSLMPYDMSLKDLRKINPKMRLDVPGDVLSAAVKAATEKVTAKYEAKLTEAAAKVAAAEEKAKNARRKFDLTGAGSRMENLGDKTVGKTSSGFDLSKPSSEYFAEARAEQGN